MNGDSTERAKARWLQSALLGEQAPPDESDDPAQTGDGDADGGAHGPPPDRVKLESDHLLDVIFGGNHSHGQAWTK